MAKEVPAFWTRIFKQCLLLPLFFLTAKSELCSEYADTFIERTPELYDDTVAFNFTRVDGFNFNADIRFLNESFKNFIRCLQKPKDDGCIIYIQSLSMSTGNLFYYRSFSPQTGIGGNPSTSHNYECQLPDRFYNNAQASISCSESEKAGLQECFKNPVVCISFIPQNTDGPQRAYNVIWNSRGNITFSYNKKFVIVEPCSKQPSDDTDSIGVIVGVVCVLLVIVILIVIVVIYWRRKKASAKGLRHCQGTSSSAALAALDQTDSSPENAETSFSRNTYAAVNKAYSSPYEQIDRSGAGYSAVHTVNTESKYENQNHGRLKNIPKADAGPYSTVNQHLQGEPASVEDGTIHSNQPGQEYSRLHENKRNFTNPYNELLKPKEDPKQRQQIPTPDASSGGFSTGTSGTYSLAKIEKTPTPNEGDSAAQQTGEKPVHKFKLKESPESTLDTKDSSSNSADNNEHKYFVLEKEDGATERDDAESKGCGHKYFILEKEDDNTKTDN